MFKKLLIKLGFGREYEYTHWDIHALARMMAPDLWVAVDIVEGSIEGTSNHYTNYPELKQSFYHAINMLKHGHYPSKRNLKSVDDVVKFQLGLNIKRLRASMK